MTGKLRQKRTTQTLAAVRQAIWEAHQFTDLPELERYCCGVIDEIFSDLP